MSGRGLLVLILLSLTAGADAWGQSAADAPGPDAASSRLRSVSTGRSGVVAFPDEKLFRPLVADPREPRFLTSVLHSRSGTRETTLASVGMGEVFGLLRWPGPATGTVMQLDLSAGVFAQFDLETESFDLVNADYLVGLALNTRRGRLAGRLELYHQSSHLGDEFLLRSRPERVNLSFEALELVVSAEPGSWRIYLGGEQVLHRDPASAPEGSLRAGTEYRQARPLFEVGGLGAVRLVAAAEGRRLRGATEGVSWSLRTGIELSPLDAAPGHRRSLSFLIEAFDGPSPYGQFYDRDLSYIGLGGRLGF